MSLSSINRTILRMNGLSSGIDTESVVKSMLAYDQARLDKQYQLKTTMEWKAEAYREINSLLKAFREANMSGLKQDSNMMSAAAYNAYRVTLLTDTKAVSVSANAEAVAGTITIDSIDHLAEAAQVSSTNAVDTPISGLNAKLGEIDFATPLEYGEDGYIRFKINGETFEFTAETTLSDMLGTVNARAGAGVRMSYSSLTKGFTIASKQTGSSSQVVIENIAGNAFGEDSAFGIAEGTKTGRNAELSINNTAVEMENNTFTIDGVTYTLKDESATAIRFNVERDVDKTVDMVKNFVAAYNELIGKLQAKLDEDSYARSYPPLTDEQRESLTEAQQKKWDELAKSGMLRNDGNIAGLLDKLRSAFYTAVAGTGKTPSDLGLNTGLYSDKGKITVDETALRQAVENNPDEVMRLFTATSNSTDPNIKFQESGLINRISDQFLSYTSNSTKVTLYNLDMDILRAEDKMDRLQQRLADKEEALWARFTAMEAAMSKLNSQSSWLASQLSSTTGNQ